LGFGTVAAQTIMFIAIVTISTGLVVVYRDVLDDSSASMRLQGQVISNKLKTDIEIISVDYDNVTEETTVYVKNTGKTKLDPEKVDVFVDKTRIPRNSNNRTIDVLADTEIHNIGIWDPNEDVEIIVDMVLNESISHTVQ